MGAYILRRLILLPITLFFIVLVNFVIINLAPGEPVSVTEVSPEMASRRADRASSSGDERYLQFREFYGLTLPILWNNWPWTTQETVNQDLNILAHGKNTLPVKQYDALRVSFGDRSRYIMPQLLQVINDPQTSPEVLKWAVRSFIRGSYRQANLGSGLTEDQRLYNDKISGDYALLRSQAITSLDTPEQIAKKKEVINQWYKENETTYHFVMTSEEKWSAFFFQTRFYKYMSRVLKLDFGTMRNDSNKRVIDEVSKRIKYSLTLSLLPMVIAFFLCLFFGFFMAYFHKKWPDVFLNLIFLILYALPIFVVAPFLIEKIAFNGHFWGTNIPIPLSGFSSSEQIYSKMTSWQRLLDIGQHLFLPILAILYGTLAAQTRLARTAVLESMRHDYVRTAYAKGLSTFQVLWKHVGRNAGITIVTSLAGSLGVILGGALIVETLFEIDGFGRFFYEAVVNRDYNVIMFSTLAGSFLTLVGYLIADLVYTMLDPRVSLE